LIPDKKIPAVINATYAVAKRKPEKIRLAGTAITNAQPTTQTEDDKPVTKSLALSKFAANCSRHRVLETRQFSKKLHHHRKQNIARVAAA